MITIKYGNNAAAACPILLKFGRQRASWLKSRKTVGTGGFQHGVERHFSSWHYKEDYW